MTRALLCAAALVGLLLSAPAARACGCPKITRDKIIELAKSGVGCPYVWGGTCWNPANHHTKGADCSGYVTKCWQIPAASAVTTCTPHYYTTVTFKYSSTHWSSVSRSSMLKGDALVYNSGGAGHIILFEAYTKTSGCYQEYEARGSAYGIQHRVKCPDGSYQARRRHNLVTPPPPPPPNTPPKGTLDAATCTSVEGWAQDPDVKTTSISVRIFVDSLPGAAGAVSYTVKADKARTDLTASLGSANHGFLWAVPAKLKDGKTHTLHVYALDSAGGKNPELTGSPKKITCTVPVGAEAGADPTPDDAGIGRSDGEAAPMYPIEPPRYENPVDNPEDVVGGCSVARSGGSTLALLVVALAATTVRRRRRR